MFNFRKEKTVSNLSFFHDPKYIEKVSTYTFHDGSIDYTILDEERVPIKNENGGYHYITYIMPRNEFRNDMTPTELSKYSSMCVLISPYHYIVHMTEMGFSGRIGLITEDILQDEGVDLETLYYILNSDDEDDEPENEVIE